MAVSRPDVLSVKNTMVAVQLLQASGLTTDRMKLVVNFDDLPDAIPSGDIEHQLGIPVICSLPSSTPTMISSTEQQPVMLAAPRDPVSRRLADLADHLVSEHVVPR